MESGDVVRGSIGYSYDNNLRVIAKDLNGYPQSIGYDNDGFVIVNGELGVTRDLVTGDVRSTQIGAITTSHSTNAFDEQDTLVAKYQSSELYSNQVDERDDLGRIVRRTERVLGVSSQYRYEYDATGRLERVLVNGAEAEQYSYDANGNRTSRASASTAEVGSYDEQDRMQTYGANAYSYSSAGDLKTKTDGAGVTTYDYDVYGSLRAVDQPSGARIHYDVDALNRRIGKRTGGARVYGLLYDKSRRPVAQVDGSNNLNAVFMYGLLPNVPDYIVNYSGTFRVISDAVGSVRLVVNTATGEIAQRIDYDAFGRVLNDTNPGFQPFGFAGGLYDADTGLVRIGARDYDGVTGRWTSKEPLIFPRGEANVYSYAGGDPVNRVDFDGRFYWLAAAAAVAAAAAAYELYGVYSKLKQNADNLMDKSKAARQKGDDVAKLRDTDPAADEAYADLEDSMDDFNLQVRKSQSDEIPDFAQETLLNLEERKKQSNACKNK